MQSNLRRYLLWQLRDFVRERGYAVLIVGFLLGFTVVGPVRGMGRAIDANLARTMLIMILTQVGFILPFITLNGIVSTDRKMGYYRFLFSKPVSIPGYYIQLFIVYFIGFLAATLILLGAFSIFAHPAWGTRKRHWVFGMGYASIALESACTSDQCPSITSVMTFLRRKRCVASCARC